MRSGNTHQKWKQINFAIAERMNISYTQIFD